MPKDEDLCCGARTDLQFDWGLYPHPTTGLMVKISELYCKVCGTHYHFDNGKGGISWGDVRPEYICISIRRRPQ